MEMFLHRFGHVGLASKDVDFAEQFQGMTVRRALCQDALGIAKGVGQVAVLQHGGVEVLGALSALSYSARPLGSLAFRDDEASSDPTAARQTFAGRKQPGTGPGQQ